MIIDFLANFANRTSFPGGKCIRSLCHLQSLFSMLCLIHQYQRLGSDSVNHWRPLPYALKWTVKMGDSKVIDLVLKLLVKVIIRVTLYINCGDFVWILDTLIVEWNKNASPWSENTGSKALALLVCILGTMFGLLSTNSKTISDYHWVWSKHLPPSFLWKIKNKNF